MLLRNSARDSSSIDSITSSLLILMASSNVIFYQCFRKNSDDLSFLSTTGSFFVVVMDEVLS